MIDVKEAIVKALDFMKSVYSDSILNGLLLEETELSEDSKKWYITFSYLLEKDPDDFFDALNGGKRFVRTYKIITIDSDSGTVYSMKIRPT